MEVGSERERLRSSKRETSPDRVKTWRLKAPIPPPPPPPCSGSRRKVQIVYYLSRNGVLEHPHFMELSLEPSQVPLRLKHVFDRLMDLRGRGMPLQYSWSSKRKYKSGYVWHDLAPKDILHPSHSYSNGLEEYVLKGSHLLLQSPSADIIQGLNPRNKQAMIPQVGDPNYSYNLKNQALINSNSEYPGYAYDDDEEEEEEQQHGEEKTRSSYTTSSTPHSRCSRGVSTDEELLLHDDVNTSSKVSALVPGGNMHTLICGRNNNKERRVVLLENEGAAPPSRHSLLLQLIACGTSALDMKGKRESVCVRKLQCEDKEYFSGSLVDSMKAQAPFPLEAHLTRSNSYDEHTQRGRSRLGMEANQEEGGGGLIHKCIPRKKSSNS
ncbi:hypothetical protein PIB30_019337 [Stylosanthes scabra]|uniref:SOSEKI DIX-like domain-containing protein n=1 Tax=Stylosanthes scabra TaxID=79078 RepID=A0ABU6W6A0_9FABA|nr:hypothetical protein [Stylosanthes scabra]